MKPQQSLPPAYFEDVYGAAEDPWNFESSAYEAAKYSATLAALPRQRYRRALEIGCSIGVLTARLAPRCDKLLALDINQQALNKARDRCEQLQLSQVAFARMQVPSQFPVGTFDLVVLSEVGYYWSAADLTVAADKVIAALRRQASLLLVHWTAPVADYPLDGDDVHDYFFERAQQGRIKQVQGARTEHYRLDLFRRQA